MRLARSSPIHPGLKVGALTVVEPGEPRVVKESRSHKTDKEFRLLSTWLCDCDCGGKAIRTDDRLRRALRKGEEPCCRGCHQELARGIKEMIEARRLVQRSQRKARFLEMWEERSCLWSDWSNTSLRKRILQDLCLEFGPLPEEDVELPVERGAGWDGSKKAELGEGFSPNVYPDHDEAERLTLAQLKDERRCLREMRTNARKRERLLVETDRKIERAEEKLAKQIQRARAAWEPSLTQWLIEHANDLVVDDLTPAV